MLELAILGLLNDSPLHGYELRKRLNANLGMFRAFSYGSLYPALRTMQAAGWITTADPGTHAGAPALTGKRGRVVYELTADGKEKLAELLSEAGPSAWEDETFGVHFALFAQTDAATRLRILEGRRSRVEERREGLRATLSRTRARLDTYTLELQRHGLESVDREVRWLTELIESERNGSVRSTSAVSSDTSVAAGTSVEAGAADERSTDSTGHPDRVARSAPAQSGNPD